MTEVLMVLIGVVGFLAYVDIMVNDGDTLKAIFGKNKKK